MAKGDMYLSVLTSAYCSRQLPAAAHVIEAVMPENRSIQKHYAILHQD